MRFASRLGRSSVDPALFPSHVKDSVHREEDLLAFRGFLIAASASALLWGLLLAGVWLVRSRF